MDYLTIFAWVVSLIFLALLLIILFKPPWFNRR
jgi:hypothetical protein